MNLLEANFEKLQKSHALVESSLSRLQPLEPATLNDPLAMEPYDALASRFERFVEIALNRFFRSVEIHFNSKSSETLRDRLLQMQKLGIITSVDLWMEMRDFHNRIAHDYLPEQLVAIFNGIQSRFASELRRCLSESEKLMSGNGAQSHVST